MIKRSSFGRLVIAICFLVSTVVSFPFSASAASLTALSDTMSRMGVSEASNHTVKFSATAGVGAGQTIVIDFPDGFGKGSTDYTDVDVAYSADLNYGTDLTLAATPSGSTWGVAWDGGSARQLTITSGTGTIASGQNFRVLIGTNASGGDAQMTNPSSAGTVITSITVAATDSGKIAVAILDTDLDQVSLTATVNPSLTFSLSGNSSAFGDLSTGSVTTSSSNITLTIGTNAQNGYTVAVFDVGSSTNPGLYNSSASYLIGSADSSYGDTATLAAGTEGFGIQGASAEATIAARYNQTSNAVGGLEITPATLATYGSSMNASHTVTVTHKAAVSSWTPAGAYSDTLTYLATGNF